MKELIKSQDHKSINKCNNTGSSIYQTKDTVLNSNFVEMSQEPEIIELEQLSNNNSIAKYTKNIQIREKILKKTEREKSTPSRLNEEYGLKNLITGSLETESVSNNYNNSVWQQDSTQRIDIDNFLCSSMTSKDNLNGLKSKDKKLEMRSSSLSSSNYSFASESTSSNQLIGWSYQKTRDGKL